jgi:hypothetical protein
MRFMRHIFHFFFSELFYSNLSVVVQKEKTPRTSPAEEEGRNRA